MKNERKNEKKKEKVRKVRKKNPPFSNVYGGLARDKVMGLVNERKRITVLLACLLARLIQHYLEQYNYL